MTRWKVDASRRLDSPTLRLRVEWGPGCGLLELEELAEAAGLRAAHGNFGVLAVIHAELVAGFEPRHDLLDVVDVDYIGAVGAPEGLRVEQIQQLFQGAALRLAFERGRRDGDDALIDG